MDPSLSARTNESERERLDAVERGAIEGVGGAGAEIDALLRGDGLRALAVAVTGRSADADDLAQEAWIALARRASAPPGSLPPIERPRAWVGGVLRNLERERRSRESLHAEAEQRALVERERARAAELDEADLDRVELSRELRAQVRALPARMAEVVELQFLEGLSSEEISRRLGRPNTTVRSQSARGIALLRERLLRVGREGLWAACVRVALADAPAAADVVTCQPLRLRPHAPHAPHAPHPSERARERANEGTKVARRVGPSAWRALAAGIAACVALVILVVTSLGNDGDAVSTVGAAFDARAPSGNGDGKRAFGRGERALSDAAADTRVPATEAAPRALGTPAAAESTARITVVDAAGAPVEGARVRCVVGNAAREAGATDARGELAFAWTSGDLASDVNVFAPTKLALEALGPRATRSRLVFVDAARLLERPLTLTLERGGTLLRGRVRDADGVPLAGADVRAGETIAGSATLEAGVTAYESGAPLTTDAEGRFELFATPGEQVVRVRRAGGPFVRFVERIEPGEFHDATLVIPRGQRVHGVVRRADATAAAGARVFAEALAQDAVHDVIAGADGRFELIDLAPGAVAIHAELDGAHARTTIDGRAGDTTEWNSTLEPGRELRVRVVDAAHEPLAAWCVVASVPIEREDGARDVWQRMAASDARGIVDFTGVPAGTMSLITAPVRRVVPYPVLERELADDGARELVLQIADARSASGVWSTHIGGVRGRATLWLRREGMKFVSSVQVEFVDGVGVVDGLPWGEYELALALRGGEGQPAGVVEWSRVTVNRADAVPSEVELPQPARLEIAGMRVGSEWQLVSRASFAAEVLLLRRTAAEASYALDVLPGAYEVRCGERIARVELASGQSARVDLGGGVR